MNTAPAPSNVDASRCVSWLVPMNARHRGEVQDVRGRMARARRLQPPELEARRVDEPVALGHEVGLPVVVGGVAVEEDAALLVDHVRDAPHERDEGDGAEPEPESLARGRRRRLDRVRAVFRPRHDGGTYHPARFQPRRPRRRMRSRMAHNVTSSIASATIRLDIFDVPRTRSVNEIGTSSMLPARAQRAVGHLDLERVAGGVRRLDVHRLQDRRAVRAVARGGVAHAVSERERGVPVAPHREQQPAPGPVGHAGRRARSANRSRGRRPVRPRRAARGARPGRARGRRRSGS